MAFYCTECYPLQTLLLQECLGNTCPESLGFAIKSINV